MKRLINIIDNRNFDKNMLGHHQYKKHLLILSIFLFAFTIILPACTIGVASGKVTQNGKPLLWKTRDNYRENYIYYTPSDRKEEVGFVSGKIPEDTVKRSFYGLNQNGFAIVNSHISYFEIPENNLLMDNGELMELALTTCSTVEDFQAILDSTNKTGRGTGGAFAVIDANGGAAMFEVSANKYWKYSTDGSGYVVRTNFSFHIQGAGGLERYKRSTSLIGNLAQKKALTVKAILRIQMRDLVDSRRVPVDKNWTLSQTHIFEMNDNLCRPTSIATVVVEGVNKSEPAFFSTMWSMLGNPFTAIATPYWPIPSESEIIRSSSDKLYQISSKLKPFVFNLIKQGKSAPLINLKNQRDIMQNLIVPTEDSILVAAMNQLKKWRGMEKLDKIKKEMLKTEEELVSHAYEKMNEYSKANLVNELQTDQFQEQHKSQYRIEAVQQ